MARWSTGGHNLSIVKFFISVLICVILFTPSSSALIVDASEKWNETYLVEGGRSLLVEELSATWCESCAEIDPYLMEVADSHGSRIAMVTYHPSDGVDAFQPLAAKHRIERLSITHPGIGSTPTFIVDGGQQRIGPQSWLDVQKDILSKEVTNLKPRRLGFEISKNNNETFTASIKSFSDHDNGVNKSQLTFMLVKHSLTVPEGFDNPGGKYRDRVVHGLVECNLQNNSITYSSGFLYYVSVMGTTGHKSANISELEKSVSFIKKYTNMPVIPGFGIKNAQDVNNICKIADGAVVGSSIIKIIEENINNKDFMLKKIDLFTKNLKLGTKI